MNTRNQQLRARMLGVMALILIGSGLGCGLRPEEAQRQSDQRAQVALKAAWDPNAGPQDMVKLPEPNEVELEYKRLADAVKASGTLTLNQAIGMGLLVNPAYRRAIEQMYMAGLREADVRHLYAFNPFAGGAVGYGKDEQDEAGGGQVQAGFKKLLASGAQISSDLTLGYFDVMTGEFRSGTSSLLRVAITQPLLQGAQRTVVMERLTQAQRDTLYAIRDYVRYRKGFCVSLASDYCRAVQRDWERENARNNLGMLEKAYRQMEQLSLAGRLSRHELQQARQDVLDGKTRLAEAELAYEAAMDQLKLQLLLPPELELKVERETPLLKEWSAVLAETTNDEQQAVELGLGQRLDLANRADLVEDAKRHVAIAADGLKGTLDVVVRAAPREGRSQLNFDDKAGELNTDQDRYEVGLRGDLGIDRTLAAHAYRRAQIALSQAQRDYEQYQERVATEIRKARREMSEAKSRYERYGSARNAAQERLTNVMLLMKYGRANTRDVLDAQRDLLKTENEYADALADYAIAEMNYLRDTELLWLEPDGHVRLASAEEQDIQG